MRIETGCAFALAVRCPVPRGSRTPGIIPAPAVGGSFMQETPVPTLQDVLEPLVGDLPC